MFIIQKFQGKGIKLHLKTTKKSSYGAPSKHTGAWYASCKSRLLRFKIESDGHFKTEFRRLKLYNYHSASPSKNISSSINGVY